MRITPFGRLIFIAGRFESLFLRFDKGPRGNHIIFLLSQKVSQNTAAAVVKLGFFPLRGKKKTVRKVSKKDHSHIKLKLSHWCFFHCLNWKCSHYFFFLARAQLSTSGGKRWFSNYPTEHMVLGLPTSSWSWTLLNRATVADVRNITES